MADPERRSERRHAVLRIAPGQAQLVGAVVSLVLPVQTGRSEFTAVAVAVTYGCGPRPRTTSTESPPSTS